MKFLIALFLSLPAFASAADDSSSLPFAVAHASEQATVTSRSLQEELDQFRAISQWQTATMQLASTRVKYEESKRDFDRAKALREAGTLTETAFAVVYYNHRVLEADLIRLPNEVIQAKMTAQFHMLRVLEEGNPGVDRRAELAQVMIDGLALEIQSLNKSLELASTAKDLSAAYLKHGQELFQKSALTKADLERREEADQIATLQVDNLNKQIRLAEMARVSFQDSQAKLSQTAQRAPGL